MRLIFQQKEDSQQNQWVEKDLDCCPGSLWRSSVSKGGMQQVVVAAILVLAAGHPQARLIDQVQSLLTAIVQSACQLFCQRNVCSHNWNQVKVTVCTQMHGLVSFANIQAFVLLKEVMELIRNTFETMIKGLYILCSSRSSFVVMEAVMVVGRWQWVGILGARNPATSALQSAPAVEKLPAPNFQSYHHIFHFSG